MVLKKKNSKEELFAIVDKISKTKNCLRYYQSSLKDKRNKIAAMDKKIVQLNGLSIQNNNEEYQKIEQKVNSILTDKKMIILTAVISVLAALRNDPDKQPIIYDGEFEDKRN
jgi:hypothetical protein